MAGGKNVPQEEVLDDVDVKGHPHLLQRCILLLKKGVFANRLFDFGCAT
jgi:hypothetical protein